MDPQEDLWDGSWVWSDLVPLPPWDDDEAPLDELDMAVLDFLDGTDNSILDLIDHCMFGEDW